MATFDTYDECRYHKTASDYALPNDAIEPDRLDAQAAAIVEMIDGVPYPAPIQSMMDAKRATGIGCGTGVAAVQIANMLPSAKVYRLDISPELESVQKMASANAAWVIGNVLDVDFDRPGPDLMSQEVFVPSRPGYIFGRMLFLGIIT